MAWCRCQQSGGHASERSDQNRTEQNRKSFVISSMSALKYDTIQYIQYNNTVMLGLGLGFGLRPENVGLGLGLGLGVVALALALRPWS